MILRLAGLPLLPLTLSHLICFTNNQERAINSLPPQPSVFAPQARPRQAE
jgi:hypothetical protein